MVTRRILPSLLFFLTLPLVAEPSVDLSAAWTGVDISGNAVAPELENELDVGFDDGDGFSVSASIPLSARFSTELSVSVVDPEATFGFQQTSRSLGPIRMTPAHLTARFHPWDGGRVEPYIGAGVAWVGFEVEDQAANEAVGVFDLALSSDWTWTAQAGVRIGAGERLFANVDVRTMPIETEFTALDRLPAPLEMDPLFVSVGIGWRFGD